MSTETQGACPASDTGGHCYHRVNGVWACCLENPVSTGGGADAA